MSALDIAGGIILAVMFFAFLPVILSLGVLAVLLAVPLGIIFMWPEEAIKGLSVIGNIGLWVFSFLIVVQLLIFTLQRKSKKTENTYLDDFISELISSKEIYKGLLQVIFSLAALWLIAVAAHNF